MPINFGLHPYFNVSDFKNLEFIDLPLNCQDQERNIISNTLDELNKINDYEWLENTWTQLS